MSLIFEMKIPKVGDELVLYDGDYDGSPPLEPWGATFRTMPVHYIYYIQEEHDDNWKYIGYKIIDQKYKSIFPRSLSGRAKLKYTKLDVDSMLNDKECSCKIMEKSKFVEHVLLDVI